MHGNKTVTFNNFELNKLTLHFVNNNIEIKRVWELFQDVNLILILKISLSNE